MRAKELRIGNLVLADYNINRFFYVDDIDDEGCFLRSADECGELISAFQSYKNIHHIILNENWLLKYGFKKDDYFEESHGIIQYTLGQELHDMGGIGTDSYEFMVTYSNSDNTYRFAEGNHVVELKSVHHLQNLYHALKYQELILE